MELREQIKEILMGYPWDDDAPDQILALLPKPTVTLPCEKCGGSGGIDIPGNCQILNDDGSTTPYRQGCRACTDGKVTREIEWMYAGSPINPFIKTLSLPDLIDRDIRFALTNLELLVEHSKEGKDFTYQIPNNKGVLRMKGENDG